MIRPIRLTDIWSLERRRHVASLNFPESAVRGFSPARFGIRSALGPVGNGAGGVVLSSRMRPVAACYYECPRHSDEARLLALCSYRDEDDRMTSSWERLVERICLRAAGDGKLRVIARPEEGDPAAMALRKSGFTAATREHILLSPPLSASAERVPGFEALGGNDVWNAWKLYSRTEPVPVQRAEGLTPASWLRGRRSRGTRRQEWILRTDGEIVVHQELLTGARLSVSRLHYDSSRREELGRAVDHLLMLAARRQSARLYCVVREHQTELHSILLHRGFTSVRSQVRLVLYTSVLSYALEPQRTAVLEKAVPVFRTGVSGLTHETEGTPTPATDWYNLCKGDV